MVLNNAFATATGPDGEACSSCKHYWASVAHDYSYTEDGVLNVYTYAAVASQGICRYDPPGYNLGAHNHFSRPIVHENDWCSRYVAAS